MEERWERALRGNEEGSKEVWKSLISEVPEEESFKGMRGRTHSE